MELFNKELTKTDVTVGFSFPTHCLKHLPDFEGNNFVDLKVKDNCNELRVIRCRKRSQGHSNPVPSTGCLHLLQVIRCRKRSQGHSNPVLSTGWFQFVEDYKLRVGDKIVLFYEVDHVIGSEYKIEAKRKIRLFGEDVWADVR